jgi:ferredoxin
MTRAERLRSARPSADPAAGPKLRVDPSVCDGIGICAHLAPDLVSVDSWGYPIVSDEPIGNRTDMRQAEAAVRACPRKALHLL